MLFHNHLCTFLWYLRCVFYRHQEGAMFPTGMFACRMCATLSRPTAVYYFVDRVGLRSTGALCTCCANHSQARPPYRGSVK